MRCNICGNLIGESSEFCFLCGSEVGISSPNVPGQFKYRNAVFIDSVFVKHSIEEAKQFYPNISEEEISIEAIIEEIISYTNYENYEVFYFEVSSVPNLVPKIQIKSINSSVILKGRPIKFEKIEAGMIAIEVCNYFLEVNSRYNKCILIADDIIYGDLIGDAGLFPDLTIFRRRESDSRMAWGFYDRHGYFIDIICEIHKKNE
jgi:hypothetical protein